MLYVNKTVFVNVYDMLEPSFLTSFGYYALGIGIYHSGVEICGKEYCFGGHEYKNITGVFAVEAKSGPPGLSFKQSISIGYTQLTNDQIHKVIQDISKEYVGTSYNLLTRNCNHFTDDLCVLLTGKHAPSWINRAAKLGTMFPCVIPTATDWIEPPDLEGDAPTSSSNDQSSGSTMTYTSKSPPNSTSKSSSNSVTKKNSKHNDKSQEKETIRSKNDNHNNSNIKNNNNNGHLNESSNNIENKQIISPSLPHSHNQSTSNPTSRKSSTASMEYRCFQQNSHMYSLSSGSNNYRQSSRPSSPTSHRRPSGSVADGESIFFGRASSPIAYDDYDINDPIKEPDMNRPDIIRSATQLSINALQELDR
ncbi:unnamed protein product [Cunninghamella blakesleeana]